MRILYTFFFLFLNFSQVCKNPQSSYNIYLISCLFSVPSILRNSRYRRDQRQLDEEEEMWFNEEEDFDEGEAVVPAAAADLVPPASAKKQSSTSNSALTPALADSKSHHQQQQQQQSVLNNNTANNNITSQQSQINNTTTTTNESPITSEINPNSTIGTTEKTGTALFKKVILSFEKDNDKVLYR